MRALKLQASDGVAVALADLAKGEEALGVILREDIPRGHKFALLDISSGENVLKYGYPIGHATANISAGEHVHTHNLRTNLSDTLEYSYWPEKAAKMPYTSEGRTFSGYVRANGEVGIRNDLFIIPTVGCVNGVAQSIANAIPEAAEIFDNVTVLGHPYGCSQLGEDHAATRRILADAAKHPNAGGVLVVGLGCENLTMAQFLEELGAHDESRLRHLVAQDVEDEIEAGAKLVRELCERAKLDKREQAPLSKLRVGLKCGGSDGLSGITANPLLGAFSDWLIAQGGSAILTEVPEMFGAEQTLMARAVDEAVFADIVRLINDFKKYFADHGEPVYENPSPGNKAGGITTLEDKSLGCTQKSGHAAVVDVLAYGDRLRKDGLSLLSAPGNDLVASSALAAAGCQIVLFTTGRGTPFGSFVPTMKIATNAQLFAKKPRWMDFDASLLLERLMEAVLPDFAEAVIAIASGKKALNEQNGFREIAIFKTGVTL